MAFQEHQNLAYSTVATAPVPAASGTFLIVASGDGTIFPTPPFSATVWPANTDPFITNAEIVLVTDRIGDTFEIVRAQENSTAKNILVGYQIANTITNLTFTTIQNLLKNNEPKSYLVGTTASAPTAGTTTWVLADFANAYVALFINGQKVYNSDMGNGAPYLSAKTLSSTTITINNYTWVAGDIAEYILIKSST